MIGGDTSALDGKGATTVRRQNKASAIHIYLQHNQHANNPRQYLPLFLALFLSLTAIILSIQSHLSIRFAALDEPLRINPYFRSVEYVGLSTWQVCVMKEHVIEDVLTEVGDTTTSFTIFTDVHNDLQSGVATVLRTKYHTTHITSSNWMNEPEHDDALLASADFPYRNDDTILSQLSPQQLDCHKLTFSTTDTNDNLWNISRMCFMLGIIMGVTASCFLLALISTRVKGGKDEGKQRIGNASIDDRGDISVEEGIAALDQISDKQRATHNNSSDTRGYRPISAMYLLSYLLSSTAFLFFDSKICRTQICTMSTGAYYLLAVCVLWICSGILVLFMLRRVQRHQETGRRLIKECYHSAYVGDARDINHMALSGDQIGSDVITSIGKRTTDTTIDMETVLDTASASICSDSMQSSNSDARGSI